MTIAGGNVEIVTAVTAPLAALAASPASGRRSLRMALAWNILGLATLVNIVARSALSAPGPLDLLHTRPPNLAIGTFPYTFIAGFFAPLAVTLHVLAIRAIRARLADASASHPGLLQGVQP